MKQETVLKNALKRMLGGTVPALLAAGAAAADGDAPATLATTQPAVIAASQPITPPHPATPEQPALLMQVAGLRQ